jgi:hypothetical protein
MFTATRWPGARIPDPAPTWPGMIRNIWGDPERFKEQY